MALRDIDTVHIGAGARGLRKAAASPDATEFMPLVSHIFSPTPTSAEGSHGSREVESLGPRERTIKSGCILVSQGKLGG